MILKTKEYHPDFLFEQPKDGFAMFDGLVKLDRNNLICIAARPGMGKTALALHMALVFSQNSQKTVYIYSLELSAEQIYSRMVCALAEVDSYSMRQKEFSSKERERIAKAVEALQKRNLVVDDAPALAVEQICEQQEHANDVGMIVIDDLLLLTSEKNIPKREEEVNEISRVLKCLSKEKNVPIVITAGLWRAIERRKEKRPTLYDLAKTCGMTEREADTVIFPYRGEYYELSDTKNDASAAEICIARNRFGSVGTLRYKWQGRYMKFSPWDWEA